MKELVPLFVAAIVAASQFFGWTIDAAAIEALLTSKVAAGSAFVGAAYGIAHGLIKLYDKYFGEQPE